MDAIDPASLKLLEFFNLTLGLGLRLGLGLGASLKLLEFFNLNGTIEGFHATHSLGIVGLHTSH